MADRDAFASTADTDRVPRDDGEAGCAQQLIAWESTRPITGPEIGDAGTFESFTMPLARALSLLSRESSEYLQALEQAYARVSTSAHDIDRRLICAVSMVAAVVDHGTMSRLDVWLMRLPTTAPEPTDEPALQAWLALGDVAGFVLHRGHVDEARASTSATLLFKLLDSAALRVSADTRLMAGQLLLEYGYSSGRFELLDLVISLIEDPRLLPGASPVARARWFGCRGYLSFMRADADGAKRCWQHARSIALDAQLRGAAFMAQIGLTRQLLDEQDLDSADEVLRGLQPAEGPGRSSQVLIYKHVVARSQLMKGYPHAALLQIDEALDAAKMLGIVDGELFLLLQQRAEILFALGRHAEAQAQIEWMIERSMDTDRRIHEINLHLLKALDPSGPRADRIACLRRAFGDACTWNFSRFLRSVPDAAAQACLEALDADIESSFVSDTIRRRRLRAPPTAGAKWPWHVFVKTLGQAELRLDGKPLTSTGKVQAKPLELLFYLGSARGMRAANNVIAASLWSDEDLPRATKNLETATARLRRLLGDSSLVQVSRSQTLLDPARVWCDWAGLSQLANGVAAAAHGAEPADAEAAARALLALYDGPFLDALGDAPWVITRRREATQTFVAAAIAIHATWPAQGGSGAVDAFLEATLAQEPLSENIALTLMKVYAQSDRSADALRVFRQLRQQMSVLLGLKPGRDIDTFAQQLLRGPA